jgi:hypothetical protein
MNVKEDFHHLIDTIEDEQVLIGYYQLVKQLSDNQNGQIWNTLTEEQQQEVLLAYDESFDEKNLISHEEVKRQHEKWLKT